MSYKNFGMFLCRFVFLRRLSLSKRRIHKQSPSNRVEVLFVCSRKFSTSFGYIYYHTNGSPTQLIADIGINNAYFFSESSRFSCSILLLFDKR